MHMFLIYEYGGSSHDGNPVSNMTNEKIKHFPDDWQEAITLLLSQTSIAFLSTQGAKSPETSMVPYAIFQGDVLLHVSTLARHTQNIQTHPEVGLMICTPEQQATSILSLPRISLQGIAGKVPEQDMTEAKNTYLNHIPDAEPLFSFPDFVLYKISVHDVFWVGGFGAARKISQATWQQLFETND